MERLGQQCPLFNRDPFMTEAFKFDSNSTMTVPEATLKTLLAAALKGAMAEGVTVQNVSAQVGKEFKIVFGKEIMGGP